MSPDSTLLKCFLILQIVFPIISSTKILHTASFTQNLFGCEILMQIVSFFNLIQDLFHSCIGLRCISLL